MLELNRNGVEALLEEVLGKVTGKGVSVATLGNEISINIEGKRFNFEVLSGKNQIKVTSIPTPIREGMIYTG